MSVTARGGAGHSLHCDEVESFPSSRFNPEFAPLDSRRLDHDRFGLRIAAVHAPRSDPTAVDANDVVTSKQHATQHRPKGARAENQAGAIPTRPANTGTRAGLSGGCAPRKTAAPFGTIPHGNIEAECSGLLGGGCREC